MQIFQFYMFREFSVKKELRNTGELEKFFLNIVLFLKKTTFEPIQHFAKCLISNRNEFYLEVKRKVTSKSDSDLTSMIRVILQSSKSKL